MNNKAEFEALLEGMDMVENGRKSSGNVFKFDVGCRLRKWGTRG